MQRNYTQSTMKGFEITPSESVMMRVKKLSKVAETYSIQSCIELIDHKDIQKDLGLIINDIGVAVFIEVSRLSYRVIVEAYDATSKIHTEWIAIHSTSQKTHNMSATLMHQVV